MGALDVIAAVALGVPLLATVYRIYAVPGIDAALGAAALVAALLFWVRLESNTQWPYVVQLPLVVVVTTWGIRKKLGDGRSLPEEKRET